MKHSVKLNSDKCYGCTICIKQCPTQAIRVYGGKSEIIDAKCIDCGACVQACPNNSKFNRADSIEDLDQFKVKVAIVSPILYGQFDDLLYVETALDAVKSLGFDEVYETGLGADIYAHCAKEYIDGVESDEVISSSCPVVLRLIQLQYHDLLENIMPLKTPEEITATIVREMVAEKRGVSPDDIGIFLLTSCPAQLMNVSKPLGFAKSDIDRVISIMGVFAQLKKFISANPGSRETKSLCSIQGMGWFNVRGQTRALEQDNHLVVDEIHSVVNALDQYENDKFPGLTFFEGVACKGGCGGGALGFENTFVAKNRIDNFIAKFLKEGKEVLDLSKYYSFEKWKFEFEIPERDVNKLDKNIGEALKKYKLIEEIATDLPGLDCGACGCPSCKALAEDIVKGYASEFDCIFIMRTKLNLANRE